MIRIALIVAFALLATPAAAQTYVIEANVIAAQARSHAQALANGCKPGDVTQYWWSVAGGPQSLDGLTPPDAMSAAIVLVAASPWYADQGLSGAEKSAEATGAQLAGAGWATQATPVRTP